MNDDDDDKERLGRGSDLRLRLLTAALQPAAGSEDDAPSLDFTLGNMGEQTSSSAGDIPAPETTPDET